MTEQHRSGSPPPEPDGSLDRETLDDLDTIRREGGGAVVTELLKAFSNETPPLVETLHEAASNGDTPTFKRAAHTLNGIARTVGAKRMANICERLEDLADRGNLSHTPAELGELEKEKERVHALLIRELA